MTPSEQTIAVAEAAKEIALQMLEERGRGAVLVGVARVDAALEHLLLAALEPTGSKKDELFLPERPLGSFGAKIMLARRLGLTDEPIERALNALRKLRNSFAHATSSSSLSDAAHRSRLSEAYKEAQSNPMWAKLETVLSTQSGSPHGPISEDLRDYIRLITVLVASLEASARITKPIQPPVMVSFEGIQLQNQ